MNTKTITLHELNTLVAEVLHIAMPDSYWVEAEVSEAREHTGHLYLELIEKDKRTEALIARASAKCWRSTWALLGPYFERIAGTPLRRGIKILVCVKPQFHPQYGFSWIIEDINPDYTMGDMARKRKEIIAQLKANGIFDLQKDLTLPPFAQNIAIISSASAAGYGDFYNQLLDNEYGFAFNTQLFPAIMQGEKVEQSIIEALNKIHASQIAYDCVVIIRGGGATADLSGFDTLALAENIANFPLPIITGIGHERDESIIDLIAYQKVKTPTAAAALLIANLANTLSQIENAQATIYRRIIGKIKYETMRIEKLSTTINMKFSTIGLVQNNHIDQQWNKIKQAAAKQIAQQHYSIKLCQNQIQSAIQQQITTAKYKITLIEQKLTALDPTQLLKRGYTITTYKGKTIKADTKLKPNEELITQTQYGKIVSTIKNIQQNK